ncbi:hypothetical protein A8135_02845 [Legionella jamestowniensis]|uniref:DUF1566 domain-containing protein n=1 Tax=Legionella jamestowniensis TaxID=455 RepID=A0ABX2XS30_9GAMM|nr:hypothetical protein [Legionella jamestowniensis]OCH97428.1 hypothetical protein A8135_02845 [Legionella jamestowniensis]
MAPGTEPVPTTVTVTADNAPQTTINVLVLGYGCIYQSGFLFAVDDTTPNTGSIGGKVAALSDQADPFPGIIWSSNAGGGVVFNDIPGIYDTSTTPPDACDGNSDGACNTQVIVAFYPTINLSFYAAGLCVQYTGGGFTDWYLPAICEMGYRTELVDAGCGTQLSPTLQNMQSNLVDNGNIGNLTSLHHSSTENSADPQFGMWQQTFDTTPDQYPDGKGSVLAVRCVRALTP